MYNYCVSDFAKIRAETAFEYTSTEIKSTIIIESANQMSEEISQIARPAINSHLHYLIALLEHIYNLT